MKKTVCILALMVGFFGINFSAEAQITSNDINRTEVDEGYQLVQETTFREIFRDYICENLEKNKSDIIVSRFKVLGNKPVPKGKIYFQSFLKDEKRMTGYVRMVSAIKVNGIVRNTVRLTGWVDIFESVVCAGRELKKGDIVEEDDLYLARRNISRLSKNIFTDMDKAIGQRAKHTVKKGMCLKEWMLERPPVLSKGDVVMILAETGSIRITVPGKVLEKAYPGELIRVKNAMSEKELYARVIDNSTVMVDF